MLYELYTLISQGWVPLWPLVPNDSLCFYHCTCMLMTLFAWVAFLSPLLLCKLNVYMHCHYRRNPSQSCGGTCEHVHTAVYHSINEQSFGGIAKWCGTRSPFPPQFRHLWLYITYIKYSALWRVDSIDHKLLIRQFLASKHAVKSQCEMLKS